MTLLKCTAVDSPVLEGRGRIVVVVMVAAAATAFKFIVNVKNVARHSVRMMNHLYETAQIIFQGHNSTGRIYKCRCLCEPVCIWYACWILYLVLVEHSRICLLLVGGLETEGEYPYKGMDEKCSFVRQEARVYINGSLNISKNEDGELLLLFLIFTSLYALSECIKYIMMTFSALTLLVEPQEWY